MRLHRIRGWLLAAMIALGIGLPNAARGDDQADAAKRVYLRYCGACHGTDGKGDGIVATVLRPKPTDLTQVAKKAGGTFPFYQMVQVIDGRETVRAHGDPDMPVWGEIFKSEGTASLDDRARIQGKIMLIVDHLRAIQAK